MSEHMSWHRLYSAIYDDCRETVDQALHYLHTRALTTCLESSSTSLELAAKLGRTHILHQILHSDAFRALDKFYDRKLVCKIVFSACLEACTAGHLHVLKTLLEFFDSYSQPTDEYKVSVQIETWICRAARAGAFDIVLHFFEAFPTLLSNVALRRLIISIAYEQGRDYSTLLVLPEMAETAENIIEHRPMIDFSKPAETRAKQDYLNHKLVQRAAATGRNDLLVELHGNRLDLWPNRDFEEAMDTAAELGRTDICRTLIDNKWVKMKMGTQWEQRIYSAVENDKTDTALFLFDRFIRPLAEKKENEAAKITARRMATTSAEPESPVQGRRFFLCGARPKETKKIPTFIIPKLAVDENLEFIITLLKAAVCNNNKTLSSRLTDYASAYPGSGSKISECFNMAVTMGLPRLAMMFYSRGYKTTLCVAQRTHGVLKMERSRGIEHLGNPGADCFHASLADANVVITELLLGEGCQCWNTWTRIPMLTQAIDQASRIESYFTVAMRGQFEMNNVQPARQAEILRLLLEKFKVGQAVDAISAQKGRGNKITHILEHTGNEPWVYAKCFNAVVKPGSRVNNRHVLTTWYDFIHVTPQLDQNMFNLFTNYPMDLTEIFRSLCGSGLRQYSKKGLLNSMNYLSIEQIQTLHDYAKESGLEICDEERNLLKFEHESHHGTLSSHLRNNPRSLQSNCRLSIRRAIRAVYPIGSLDDKILSLSKYRVLPEDIVLYLLFRNEYLSSEMRNVVLRNDRRPWNDALVY